MKAVQRIPTRHSLPRRIWRAMERSWWPAIIFYLLVFTGVTVVNLWAAP